MRCREHADERLQTIQDSILDALAEDLENFGEISGKIIARYCDGEDDECKWPGVIALTRLVTEPKASHYVIDLVVPDNRSSQDSFAG